MPRACSNKVICAYVKSMTRIWPTRRIFRRGLPPARRLTPSMGSNSLSLKALTTTDRRIRFPVEGMDRSIMFFRSPVVRALKQTWTWEHLYIFFLVKIPDGKSTSIGAKEEEEELVQDLKQKVQDKLGISKHDLLWVQWLCQMVCISRFRLEVAGWYVYRDSDRRLHTGCWCFSFLPIAFFLDDALHAFLMPYVVYPCPSVD